MNAVIQQSKWNSFLCNRWKTSYRLSALGNLYFPVTQHLLRQSSLISNKKSSKTIPVQNETSTTNPIESVKLPDKFFFPHVQDALPMIILDKWKTKFRIKDVQKENSPKMIEVRECHLCSKGNKSKPDNLWKLCVFSNGGYHCFRCAESGNWSQFTTKANEVKVYTPINDHDDDIIVNVQQSSPTQTAVTNHSEGSNEDVKIISKPNNHSSFSEEFQETLQNYVFPHQEQYHNYHTNLFPPEKEYRRTDYIKQLQKERDRVKHYLHESRKLNDIVLRRYLIGFTKQSFLNDDNAWIDHTCITFPWMVPQDQIDKDRIVWADLKEKIRKNGSHNNTDNHQIIDEEEIVHAQALQQTPVEFEETGSFNYTVRMKYR